MSYFQESIKKINKDYLRVQERNDQLEDIMSLNDLDVDKKFEIKVNGKTYAYSPDREHKKRFVVRYKNDHDTCEKIKFLSELDSDVLREMNTWRNEIVAAIEKELGTCAFD